MGAEKGEEFRTYKKFKSLHDGNEKNHIKDNLVSVDEAEKEAGNYFLGPVVKKCVRGPITQCLARKKGTDDYYLMKILLLDESNISFFKRTVFHNEYSILSLLKNYPGVIQVHELFKDYILTEDNQNKSKKYKLKRVCMVLECLIPHRHYNSELIALDDYIKKEKLSECEALHIFYNLLLVIKELHKRNIIHRNLKLSNVVLNQRTLKVKLVDFFNGKLLISDTVVECNKCRKLFAWLEDLPGQRLFYKTYDIWSAGIILHSMLFGSMPFAGSSSKCSLSTNCSLCDMYIRVKRTDCTILNNSCVSEGTKNLLKSILCRSPQSTLNVDEVLDMVSTLLAESSSQNSSDSKDSKDSDQIVPECLDYDFNYKQECEVKVNLNSSSYSEIIEQPRKKNIKGINQNATETDCSDLENFQGNSSKALKCLEPNKLTKDKQIKVAMLRLGATSLSSINALSFSYCKKNSRHS